MQRPQKWRGSSTEQQTKGVHATRLGMEVALIRAKRYAESLPFLEEAIALGAPHAGNGHVGWARTHYARCLDGLGRREEARRAINAACKELQATLSSDHPRTQRAHALNDQISASPGAGTGFADQ